MRRNLRNLRSLRNLRNLRNMRNPRNLHNIRNLRSPWNLRSLRKLRNLRNLSNLRNLRKLQRMRNLRNLTYRTTTLFTLSCNAERDKVVTFVFFLSGKGRATSSRTVPRCASIATKQQRTATNSKKYARLHPFEGRIRVPSPEKKTAHIN